MVGWWVVEVPETQPHGPEETFVQPIMLESFLPILSIHLYSSPGSGSCVEGIVAYLLRQVACTTHKGLRIFHLLFTPISSGNVARWNFFNVCRGLALGTVIAKPHMRPLRILYIGKQSVIWLQTEVAHALPSALPRSSWGLGPAGDRYWGRRARNDKPRLWSRGCMDMFNVYTCIY